MKVDTAFFTATRRRRISLHHVPIEGMGGWELGHQEEEQLANGLVHHRYLEAIVFLLVRDGVDPCQLRIFLNVATATIYMEQSKFLEYLFKL